MNTREDHDGSGLMKAGQHGGSMVNYNDRELAKP
jgi:hypothetical protein